jgi:hypothetical protein
MRGLHVDAQCVASRVGALTVCSQDVMCGHGKAPPYTTVAGIVSEGRCYNTNGLPHYAMWTCRTVPYVIFSLTCFIFIPYSLWLTLYPYP